MFYHVIDLKLNLFFAYSVLWLKKHQLGLQMESDWENERPAFIAGEVGEAAIWLILKG